MAKYKCAFVGDCDRATRGDVLELEPGADLKCPGCNNPMQLAGSQDEDGGQGRKKMVMAAAAGIGALVLAGGAWFGLRGSAAPGQAQAAAPAASVQTAAPSGPVVKTSATPSGIAPSDAEVAQQKAQAQASLTTGQNSQAASDSAKAASNEMVKLGIAKLAQGKYDEAEKSFKSALDVDPKQSLAYYNMAILRLRQGRSDDAMQQFEASFMNGFSHFDKLDDDHDLDAIRKDKRFGEMVAKYRPAVIKQ
jgi:tetratricopeptide (TPR) repeat protein